MADKKAKKTTAKKATTKVKDNELLELTEETFVVAAGAPKDDAKTTLVTRGGLEALKKELEYLESTRRREIAARIKEAVSYGDLSENSEYEEAKNEQAFVEGRILQLTEQVKYAQIIDDEAAAAQSKSAMTVQLGNKVTIKALSGKTAGQSFEYIIVGTTEADPMNGKISNESPVGMSVLNTRVGDKVDVKVPVGTITFQIINIV